MSAQLRFSHRGVKRLGNAIPILPPEAQPRRERGPFSEPLSSESSFRLPPNERCT